MGDEAFDLESFAPPDTIKFRLRKHGDHEFVIDGDPDTGDVALMLRIEEQMRSADNEADAVLAADEGKSVLLRLVQERQPEITELKVGMQEVLVVFSLIIRGSSVAEAVARAVTASGKLAEPGELGDDEPALGEGEPGPQGAEVTPLPSAEHSLMRSSSSDEHAAGLPATGTG